MQSTDTLILFAHLAATFVMVGVIWFVQVVHYPLFARVSDASFVEYEARHVQATGFVVGPPMLLEAATVVWLVAAPPSGLPVWAPWLGALMLAVIWISTALLQVPAHERLQRGFDALAHQRLVSTNWIRTILWSARGVLAIGIMMF